MQWQCLSFEQLGPQSLYELLALRSAVFVVEQQCLFQDLDGLDAQALHLLGRDDSRQLGAYARLLPPGLKQAEALIGRVVTSAAHRGAGQGRALMREAVAEAHRRWPGQRLGLHAQAHLEGFYASFGFRPVGQPYVEDGIPHIEMQETP
jgi:ElaA protein